LDTALQVFCRPTLEDPVTTRITHLIDGEPWAGTAERTSPVFNPATGVQTGELDLASADLVGEVVAHAHDAWRTSWASTSLARRTAVLFRFRELLDRDKHEIAALITAEHGKVLEDALGEVTRGLEVAEFACGIPHLLKGGHTENASTSVDVFSLRQPLGVVAVISPFNFPAMVPLWFVPVALACGNAVVVKPSEKDPSATLAMARLWTEAGLPDGVLSVVNGDKEAVDALLTHPEVKSVSFVGSTPIARYVYETGTAHGKRVQALGGAKNHMLVLPDADLDLAADAAVNAGFGSAGERCMAISALVVVEPVADELVAKIAERVAGLRTGDGTRGCDMGPVVTAASRDRIVGFVAAGEAAGATLVVDGREGEWDADGGPDGERGFFVGPTLFDRVTTDMSVYTEEIFGPVLSVLRVASYDEGLALINANPYGNGTAIFTHDGGAARRFQHEVEVGMVGINVPVPVPVAYYSFGGWKSSLFGDSHAHGTEGVHFFTRGKVVTQRWPDPSHGGLDLGFPQNR
jgi:malonate-semialdehyde dehydrogenase (acetylating) / methylmalonate-semialdehyde dehydrogenase